MWRAEKSPREGLGMQTANGEHVDYPPGYSDKEFYGAPSPAFVAELPDRYVNSDPVEIDSRN